MPHVPPAYHLELVDESATRALGERLGASLRPGCVVHLQGELGTGKTTLVRACLRALGYAGRVKSPTYTLVEPYELSKLSLYHFDFYRLEQPEECLDAGFREYFNNTSVCLVEWPERMGGLLPDPDLRIHLRHAGTQRTASLESLSPRGAAMLQSAVNGVASPSRP